MIGITERCKRTLRNHKKRFLFAVLIQACVICMVAQAVLAYLCMENWEAFRSKDEVTIFLDQKISADNRKTALEQLQALNPKLAVSQLNTKEILSGRLPDLIRKGGALPEAYLVLFPSKTAIAEIQETVKKMEAIKGINAVAADIEWMEKRRQVGKMAMGGSAILAIPLLLLAFLTFGQSTARIASIFTKEGAVLKMLGARGVFVSGPLFLASAMSWLYSFLIGAALFLITTLIGLSVILDALEIHVNLTPVDYGFALGCAAAGSLVLLLLFTSNEIRKTKPLIF